MGSCCYCCVIPYLDEEFEGNELTDSSYCLSNSLEGSTNMSPADEFEMERYAGTAKDPQRLALSYVAQVIFNARVRYYILDTVLVGAQQMLSRGRSADTPVSKAK